MNSQFAQPAGRADHVVRICSGFSDCAPYHVDLGRQAELAGILIMGSVHDVCQRRCPATVGKINASPPFQIDIRDLLPLAQIINDRLAMFATDAETKADACAAMIQSENKSRPAPRAAMDPGIDA